MTSLAGPWDGSSRFGSSLLKIKLKYSVLLCSVGFAHVMQETPRGISANPGKKEGRTTYGIHFPYTPLLDKEDEELGDF